MSKAASSSKGFAAMFDQKLEQINSKNDNHSALSNAEMAGMFARPTNNSARRKSTITSTSTSGNPIVAVDLLASKMDIKSKLLMKSNSTLITPPPSIHDHHQISSERKKSSALDVSPKEVKKIANGAEILKRLSDLGSKNKKNNNNEEDDYTKVDDDEEDYDQAAGFPPNRSNSSRSGGGGGPLSSVSSSSVDARDLVIHLDERSFLEGDNLPSSSNPRPMSKRLSMKALDAETRNQIRSRRISVTNLDSVYPVHRGEKDDFEVTNPALGNPVSFHGGAIAYYPGAGIPTTTTTTTTSTTTPTSENINTAMQPYLGTIDQSFFTERHKRNSIVAKHTGAGERRQSLRVTRSAAENVAHHRSQSSIDSGILRTTSSEASISSALSNSDKHNHHQKSLSGSGNMLEFATGQQSSENAASLTAKPAKRSGLGLFPAPRSSSNLGIKDATDNSNNNNNNRRSNLQSQESKRGLFGVLSRMMSGSISVSNVEGGSSKPSSTSTTNVTETLESSKSEIDRRIHELANWLKLRDPHSTDDFEAHSAKLLTRYDIEKVSMSLLKLYNAVPSGWYEYLPEHVRQERLNQSAIPGSNFNDILLDEASAGAAAQQIERFKAAQDKQQEELAKQRKKDSGGSSTVPKSRRFSLFG